MGAIIAHHGLLLVSAPSYGALPFSDGFDTNTIANYTVRQDSGTPAWTISGSAMNVAGVVGSQSTCTVNGFSQADVSAEVITSGAADSGVVVRYQNQNNFYLVTMSDGSGTNPTQQLRLFKRVSGTFTQLGSSVNMGWTHLATHTVRLTATGNSIVVYFDGVAQISVTDSSISAAGSVGMRSNASSGDFFAAFNWG